jgi:hypothetical protein
MDTGLEYYRLHDYKALSYNVSACIHSSNHNFPLLLSNAGKGVYYGRHTVQWAYKQIAGVFVLTRCAKHRRAAG